MERWLEEELDDDIVPLANKIGQLTLLPGLHGAGKNGEEVSWRAANAASKISGVRVFPVNCRAIAAGERIVDGLNMNQNAITRKPPYVREGPYPILRPLALAPTIIDQDRKPRTGKLATIELHSLPPHGINSRSQPAHPITDRHDVVWAYRTPSNKNLYLSPTERLAVLMLPDGNPKRIIYVDQPINLFSVSQHLTDGYALYDLSILSPYADDPGFFAETLKWIIDEVDILTTEFSMNFSRYNYAGHRSREAVAAAGLPPYMESFTPIGEEAAQALGLPSTAEALNWTNIPVVEFAVPFISRHLEVEEFKRYQESLGVNLE